MSVVGADPFEIVNGFAYPITPYSLLIALNL